MNNNALVPAGPAGTLPLSSLADVMTLGEVLAKSGMFETARTAAQAVVKIMTGRELGFGPMASLIDIHFFDGKPTVGAHLRAAAIKRSGWYDYRVVRLDREACELEYLERKGDRWESVGTVAMTLKEAVQSGVALAKDGRTLKANWARVPDDMLFARCISKGYRRYCPDLSCGVLVYDADELDAGDTPAPAPAGVEVLDAGYTVNGVEVESSPPTPPASQLPADPTPPASPVETAGAITEQEAEGLKALAREHHRTVGEVRAVLAAIPVPELGRVPRDRLEWVRQALVRGLTPADQVDRIAKLVDELGLPWPKVQQRLRERYGVTSVAHLFPQQADQLEASLSEALTQRRLQPATGAAAPASTSATTASAPV